MSKARRPEAAIYLDGREVNAIDKGTAAQIHTQYVTAEGVYSFSDEGRLLRWLAKKKVYQAAHEEQEARAVSSRRLLGRLSPAARTAYQRKYASMLALERRAMESRMKIAGVKRGEDLETTKHPGLKGFGSSAWLYRHCDWSSLCLYMPVNSTLPELFTSGCNDVISSLSVHTGWGSGQSLKLWEHTLYRGRAIVVVASSTAVYVRVRCLKGTPYWFNDKASSVLLTQLPVN
jgi:hypothetical protein